ncbi:MAG: hypothetical protein IKR53_02070, partial [Clostridia bacterium]|nr:hypothetical protein [Clostridia bacterium]
VSGGSVCAAVSVGSGTFSGSVISSGSEAAGVDSGKRHEVKIKSDAASRAARGKSRTADR